MWLNSNRIGRTLGNFTDNAFKSFWDLPMCILWKGVVSHEVLTICALQSAVPASEHRETCWTMGTGWPLQGQVHPPSPSTIVGLSRQGHFHSHWILCLAGAQTFPEAHELEDFCAWLQAPWEWLPFWSVKLNFQGRSRLQGELQTQKNRALHFSDENSLSPNGMQKPDHQTRAPGNLRGLTFPGRCVYWFPWLTWNRTASWWITQIHDKIPQQPEQWVDRDDCHCPVLAGVTANPALTMQFPYVWDWAD